MADTREFLFGHTSPETAYVVDDYPYGFRERTQIRYWIESAPKRGDRFVSQTKNPKTGYWNAPKPSTYAPIGVITKNPENGHISWVEISPYDSDKAEAFVKQIGGVEKLNDLQKQQYNSMMGIKEPAKLDDFGNPKEEKGFAVKWENNRARLTFDRVDNVSLKEIFEAMFTLNQQKLVNSKGASIYVRGGIPLGNVSLETYNEWLSKDEQQIRMQAEGKKVKPVVKVELFNKDNIQEFSDLLKSSINAPFVGVRSGIMGSYNSAYISIALQPKEEWSGGYYENSLNINFSIDSNGTLEYTGRSYKFKEKPKFRKVTVKSTQDLIARINKHLDELRGDGLPKMEHGGSVSGSFADYYANHGGLFGNYFGHETMAEGGIVVNEEHTIADIVKAQMQQNTLFYDEGHRKVEFETLKNPEYYRANYYVLEEGEWEKWGSYGSPFKHDVVHDVLYSVNPALYAEFHAKGGSIDSERLERVNGFWENMYEQFKSNDVHRRVLTFPSTEAAAAFKDDFKKSDYKERFIVLIHPLKPKEVKISRIYSDAWEMADGGDVEGKKKKVIRRNLPINKKYTIVDAFYTGGIENAQICENCGRPITNCADIEDEDKKRFIVGMDCASTLSGIKDSSDYRGAEVNFNEAKAIRAKVQKKMKEEGSVLTVENSPSGNINVEVTDKRGGRLVSEYLDKEFTFKYLPDIVKHISNPEKNNYVPTISPNYDFGVNIGTYFKSDSQSGEKKSLSVNAGEYKIDIDDVRRIARRIGQGGDGRDGSFYLPEITISIYKGGELVKTKKEASPHNIAHSITWAINEIEFEKFNSEGKAEGGSIGDFKIIGWHLSKRGENTGDIDIQYNGYKYRLAMSEFYGGSSAYGISKEGDDHITKFNFKGADAKKMKELYSKIQPQIDEWVDDNKYANGGELPNLIKTANKYNDAVDVDSINEKMNLYPKKYKGHVLDNIPKDQKRIMVSSSLFEKEKSAFYSTSEGTIAYHDRPHDTYWDEKINNGEMPPVLVGIHENQLRVIDGNHRLNIYLHKGFKEIPVVLTIDAKIFLEQVEVVMSEGGSIHDHKLSNWTIGNVFPEYLWKELDLSTARQKPVIIKGWHNKFDLSKHPQKASSFILPKDFVTKKFMNLYAEKQSLTKTNYNAFMISLPYEEYLKLKDISEVDLIRI